jgi:hypothetical protein
LEDNPTPATRTATKINRPFTNILIDIYYFSWTFARTEKYEHRTIAKQTSNSHKTFLNLLYPHQERNRMKIYFSFLNPFYCIRRKERKKERKLLLFFFFFLLAQNSKHAEEEEESIIKVYYFI